MFVRRIGSFPTQIDAGWSSPVARWAHNPKVGGSNPPPATTLRRLSPFSRPNGVKIPRSCHSDKHMPQTVEISLRIPSLRVRREDTDTLETINNSDVRFCKHIEMDSIPKPGIVLTMETSATGSFECEVLRSDWHHDKNMFVIACRYSKRSVSAADYHALMNSSDWQVRALI